MEKNYTLLFIIPFLIFSHNAFATSGACSSHDGVNCSAGPSLIGQDYGNVVCNDGWVNGSVSFFDTDECSNVKHACTTDDFYKIADQYNVSELRNQLSSLNKQFNQASSEFNSINKQAPNQPFLMGQSALELSISSTKVQGIGSQMKNAQDNLNSTLETVESECYKLGKIEYEQEQNRLLLEKIKEESTKETQQTLNNPSKNLNINTEINKTCISLYGSNSIYNLNKNSCECISGYSKNFDFQCVPKNEALQDICNKSGGSYNKYSKECMFKESTTIKKTPQIITKSEIEKVTVPVSSVIQPSVDTLKNPKTTTAINQNPIKLKWYQKIFNWFKGK